MIREEEVFKIGRFAKPHGVKGELSLVTNSEVFEEAEDPYLVCPMDGILVPFFIESYRYKSGSVVLVKLECVDSEEAARAFTNLDVYYPLDAVEESDLVGDMTWDSFVGYTVNDLDGNLLGAITSVDDSTVNVLFQIDYQGEPLLFPAAEELIASVDPAARQITVHVPEGLLDL